MPGALRRPRHVAISSQVRRPVSRAATASLGSGSGFRAFAAAASAAAVRSLALAPGSAFFGLLRAGRLAMPAASRKRITRSVGWAPWAIQCLARSTSSTTRSALSLASSGLKVPILSMKRPSRGERASAITML
ncbi:hypothetical protein A6302_03507 [Methylobrevis pamukkalensis]|uniref:Uncharacterized protein n=1 Tax=Methylobrevis pamukkalensis TaxID=1439726 RepID=A0A1E3GYQ0_9HYPH|nr:hypothetical protein A6302_03507 [Methylobrevis pamukkalensis]